MWWQLRSWLDGKQEDDNEFLLLSFCPLDRKAWDFPGVRIVQSAQGLLTWPRWGFASLSAHVSWLWDIYFYILRSSHLLKAQNPLIKHLSWQLSTWSQSSEMTGLWDQLRCDTYRLKSCTAIKRTDHKIEPSKRMRHETQQVTHLYWAHAALQHALCYSAIKWCVFHNDWTGFLGLIKLFYKLMEFSLYVKARNQNHFTLWATYWILNSPFSQYKEF